VIANERMNAEKEARTRTTIHPGRSCAGAFHRAPQYMESTQNMTRMTKKAPLMNILKNIARAAAILGSLEKKVLENGSLEV